MRRQTLVAALFCSALFISPLVHAEPPHGADGRTSAETRVHAARGYRGGPFTGPYVGRRVPITRPVDLVWPPVIIEPPWYGPLYPPTAAPPAGEPSSEETSPPDRAVGVKLDDCMDNADRAGYSFAGRSVVSCEDSTVDIYLSFSEDGRYYFLVPEDTQVKDIGPRTEIRTIRMIKPAGWSENHGVPLTAGHAYVVWASTGDLYLVKVDALWEKHVLFTWRWHSRLSREDAEKFQKENASGPPPAPYFSR